MDSLIKSEFGVLEPQNSAKKIELKKIDVVFIPALMADRNGYRLGYGKGFYDRFLKKLDCTKIVVIAKELVVEHLPIDDWDEAVDFVMSDVEKIAIVMKH